MKRILITGGAGFIGCNFLHFWRARHPSDYCVVLDALTYAGKLENLKDLKQDHLFRFIEGDICDQALVTELIRKDKIDTIVHFAAESHVDRSIEGPDVFIQTNVVGTHVLLSVAKQLWLDEKLCEMDHKFHHVSTDEVYGSLGPDDPAFSEKTPYAPNSPYAASKAASDHLVRAYHETYGLKVTISNCSNNFGPFQHEEKLIPTVIRKLLTGEPVPIYGDGENIRDWLYVEDHCRGLELILNKGQDGETYNIGGNNEWDNLSLCKKICSLIDKAFENKPSLSVQFPNCPATLGKPCETLINFVQDRLGHDRRYAVNASKIQQTLGFEPSEFDAPLKKLIESYLSPAT